MKKVKTTSRCIPYRPRSKNYSGTSNVGYGGESSAREFYSYLPAERNADGTYTVNISKVIFTGSVTARGEVTAYATATDEVATDIDNQLSDTSARAVENRVITRKINELENRIKELEKMKV